MKIEDEAEKWASETLDKFQGVALSEYIKTTVKGFQIYEKESWMDGFYKGYIKGKEENNKND